jgi:hypothetical protein
MIIELALVSISAAISPARAVLQRVSDRVSVLWNISGTPSGLDAWLISNEPLSASMYNHPSAR